MVEECTCSCNICLLSPETMSSIEEVTVRPKNSKTEILLSKGKPGGVNVVEKSGWNHTILRITLKNGERYAIDLTGAQYGHQENCVPWDESFATRVEQVVDVNAHGHAKEQIANEARTKNNPRNVLQDIGAYFANDLRLSIMMWEKDGEDMDMLLTLPDKEYEAKKRDLLRRVKRLMKKSRDESIRRGSWCSK